MENCSVNIAKCIFPMIRCITKSFILRRAISDFERGIQRAATSVFACAGTNGIRKPHDRPHCVAQRLFFIQQQSAGIRARKRNLEKRNIPRGRRFNVVMQLPMGATWRWRTASVTKRPPVERASNFGGKVSYADRTAKSSRKVRSIKKKLWRPRSIGLAAVSSERTGHSCEIAESMPTAALNSG